MAYIHTWYSGIQSRKNCDILKYMMNILFYIVYRSDKYSQHITFHVYPLCINCGGRAETCNKSYNNHDQKVTVLVFFCPCNGMKFYRRRRLYAKPCGRKNMWTLLVFWGLAQQHIMTITLIYIHMEVM